MKEIKIKELENIKIGSSENKDAATGCTVILCEQGMAAGLDVRGGGPASRETELLKPTAAAESIHAVLLSGGSAFGLDAAGGVMEYLEERNIGFNVGITKVPLVCESCLFDLMVGDHRVRPDKAMGYAACENAEKGNYRDGNFGVGTGATVGKLYGPEFCMKSGIGSYAVQIGELQVGAIVAVNALGDIYDWKNGKKVAGLLAQGIGTSMLQVPNIVRKPIIWIPAIVSSAVLGPVSTMLVKMTSNATGSGMGTAGFVGQIMSYQTMAPEIGGTMTMIIIVVFQIVLPAVITLAVSEFMRKKGWIKDGDMKLEL